jgi:hypothetical protein
MTPIVKRKEASIEKPAPQRLPTLDEMLDEALDETFPASDPVALTQPKKSRRTRGGVEKVTPTKGT